jgi:hypothetical protein
VLQSIVFAVVFTTSEGTFNSRITDHNWSGLASRIWQTDFEMDMETPEFVVPAGVTSIYSDFQLKFAAAGTAVTLQASQFAFPLVPAV